MCYDEVAVITPQGWIRHTSGTYSVPVPALSREDAVELDIDSLVDLENSGAVSASASGTRTEAM